MPIKSPQILSQEYYRFVGNFAQTDFEKEKILGKFYTDYDIAKALMRVLCNNYVSNLFSRDIRIIDPFCGDGRLILSLLTELIKRNMLPQKKYLWSASSRNACVHN